MEGRALAAGGRSDAAGRPEAEAGAGAGAGAERGLEGGGFEEALLEWVEVVA